MASSPGEIKFHRMTAGNGLIELSEIVAHVQAKVPTLARGMKRGGVAASISAVPVFGEQSARFGSRGEDFVLARRLTR